MENSENIINFSFLDTNEKKRFTVLIILNRPIIKNLFLKIREKVDYIICADGAANRMYDNLGNIK
jgi:thiamine pyrophosphokinase